MTLITRVSRLFRADIHAVLDRVEESDLVLRQAVRDMEQDLAQDRQRVKLLGEEQRQLRARTQEVARALSGIEEELDVCFGAGKDDLARALLRRRLEAERFSEFLSRKRSALEDNLARLEARVRENGTRLDSMRQKAELLAADEPAAPPQDRWTTPDFSVRDEDVEVAFLRERQRRERT
ncbi:MAG: PspA/IM30 family protein [Pseudomonadota bacterium]|nr:PspA/IM30 family protein [Pseudomonadota bacterium]